MNCCFKFLLTKKLNCNILKAILLTVRYGHFISKILYNYKRDVRGPHEHMSTRIT